MINFIIKNNKKFIYSAKKEELIELLDNLVTRYIGIPDSLIREQIKNGKKYYFVVFWGKFFDIVNKDDIDNFNKNKPYF